MKSALKKLMNSMGLEIRRFDPSHITCGVDWIADVSRIVAKSTNTTKLVLDVGASVGDISDRILSHMPDSKITAFEPLPDSFSKLKDRFASDPRVKCINTAVGNQECSMLLNVNIQRSTSSFLPLSDSFLPDSIIKSSTKEKDHRVDVITLDSFSRKTVAHIDLLKIDTQGYDLHVLEGAKEMLSHGKIKCIFCEVINAPYYKGQPRLSAVLDFLTPYNYLPFGFYDEEHDLNLGRLNWFNVLFVNDSKT